MSRSAVFILLLTAIFSCQEYEAAPDCIDPSKINEEAACITLYEPVCGCDNVTYSNDCVAENAGVTSWEVGECNSENPE